MSFFFFFFCILRTDRARLEQIQRVFLWVRGALEQKSHLVGWAIVCSNKSKDGLGG